MQYTAAVLALVAAASATYLHPNAGCIIMNGKSICNPSVALTGLGTVEVYAMFNGADTVNEYVTAGCYAKFNFPAYYQDIYFGADNCIYDAGGQNIRGQCCRANTGAKKVKNPYYRGQ